MAHERQDFRLVQIARLLGLGEVPDEEGARAAVSARLTEFAAALTSEAAASDDVLSSQTALDYFELRLSELASFIPIECVPALRQELARAVAGW